MVRDRRVLRKMLMLSYWPKLFTPILSSTVFSFSSFSLLVGIVGIVTSVRYGVNHSLTSLHFRNRIIIINTNFNSLVRPKSLNTAANAGNISSTVC